MTYTSNSARLLRAVTANQRVVWDPEHGWQDEREMTPAEHYRRGEVFDFHSQAWRLDDHPWQPCPGDRPCAHGEPIP